MERRRAITIYIDGFTRDFSGPLTNALKRLNRCKHSLARCYINALLSSGLITFNLD
jgi:hypothetical protein